MSSVSRFPHARTSRLALTTVAALAALALSFSALPLGALPAQADSMPSPVYLGPDLSQLALFGVTAANTGTSHVGNIGTHSGTITGYEAPSTTGTQYPSGATGTSFTKQALAEMHTAYADAAGRTAGPTPFIGVAASGTETITPGVYYSDSEVTFAANSTVTLDGQNQPDAVFIFQVDGAFNMGANSTILLTGGTVASNVFYQVAGAANMGADAAYQGIVLSKGAANLGARASMNGALYSEAAIDTDANVVQTPGTVTTPTLAISGSATRSTNDGTPTISGTTNAPDGTIISVTVDQQPFSTTATDGAWTLTATTLTEGTHTVQASVTTWGGTTAATPQTLTVDTTPPATPTITGGPAQTVNTTTPTIAGTAEPASTVTLDVCGQAMSVATDADGNWSVAVPTPLNQGECAIAATATDAAGNASQAATQTLTVDSAASHGLAITGGPSRLVTTTTPTISGTAKPNNYIFVYVCGQGLETHADSSGAWSVSVPDALDQGPCDLEADTYDWATDTFESAEQTLTVDSRAGEAPVITNGQVAQEDGSADEMSASFNGTAQTSSTVTGEVCGQSFTVRADEKGLWSVHATAPLDPEGCAITAWVVDASGSTSPHTYFLATFVPTTPASPVITGGTTQLVNTTTPTISGTADAGSTVTLDVCGQSLWAVADAAGTWSVSVTTPLDQGQCTVWATATEEGNTSPAVSQTLTIDSMAPDMPTIIDGAAQLENATTVAVSFEGTAEAGSTVTGRVCGYRFSGVADADGNWSVSLSVARSMGDCSIAATATDAAGNVSPQVTYTIVFPVDAPASPVITGGTTQVVNTLTPTVAGTAQAGSTVAVDVCGQQFSVLADADGNWSVSGVDPLDQGDCTVTATAADNEDNASLPATQTLTVDSIAPAQPTITGGATELVNTTTPWLAGTAEPGSVVTVIVCDQTLSTIANIDGNWWLQVPAALNEGDCAVSVTATDTAGNVSPAATQTLTVDSIAPDAPVITGGATEMVDNTTPTITGIAEPGAVIMLDVCGQSLEVAANAAGEWSASVSTPLAQGACTVTATATDAAGNVGPVATQALTVSSVALALTITSGGASESLTPTISGTSSAPAGTVVTVTVGGQTLSTTVNADGSWSVVAAALPEGANSVVVSIDGPDGPIVQRLTLMLSVPANVTVAQTISAGGNIEVSGTGFIPNEVVQVWFHSDPVLLGSLTAGPLGTIEGHFDAPADALPGTHHIVFIGLAGAQLSSEAITVLATLPRTGMDTDVSAVWFALGFLFLGALLLRPTSRGRRAKRG